MIVMTEVKRDRDIDQWLVEEFGDESRVLLSCGQLTGMMLATRRPNPPQVPETVLTAWRRALIRQRLTVDQSEDAFIERALAQGRTWQHLAEELGFPTSEAAQRHHDDIKAQIARTHPSGNTRPHLP
jgi:hypothetical protein